MREVWSGEVGRWWWRVMRRTHGVVLLSVHWPSRTWKQWQIGWLIWDLQLGPALCPACGCETSGTGDCPWCDE